MSPAEKVPGPKLLAKQSKILNFTPIEKGVYTPISASRCGGYIYIYMEACQNKVWREIWKRDPHLCDVENACKARSTPPKARSIHVNDVFCAKKCVKREEARSKWQGPMRRQQSFDTPPYIYIYIYIYIYMMIFIWFFLIPTWPPDDPKMTLRWS